jgi:hypothetical protein
VEAAKKKFAGDEHWGPTTYAAAAGPALQH